MEEIGNFYEVVSTFSNYAPHKLIDIEDPNYIFKNLYDQKISKVPKGYFKDIEINQTHLKRLGVENDSIQDIYIFPLYVTLVVNIRGFSSAYFGHLFFHKDDLTNMQKLFNEAQNEIFEEYNNKNEISTEFNRQIRTKLGSILNLNELFQKLESYQILISNKEEIITGNAIL